MKLLTDMPEWAGFSILLLIDALVLSLARAHDQREMQKLMHSERQRMSVWAEERADQLAKAKVREQLIEERMKRANRM